MAGSNLSITADARAAREAAGESRVPARFRPGGLAAVAASRGLATALGLIALTGIAAGLRFWRLAAIPPGFHYDEALEALEAWRVLTIPGYHPLFFPGDFGLAPTIIYLSSLAFRLWPPTPVLSRAIAALIGTVTVPCLYALGRELALADERVPAATPWLAAAILAGLRWHITFSRVAIEPILVPFYLTVSLWALFYGLRTNRPVAWLALGAALGLCVYAYPAAWLLPPLVLAIVAYLARTDRPRLRGRGAGLALAGGLAALIIAPLAVMFLREPGTVLQRTGQVAAVSPTLAETLAGLGSNLLKALGMFSVAGDLDPRSNIPGRPALDLLLAAPFYLGIVLAVWRWKRPAAGALLLATAAMLANTVFSQYAPHFRRSLGLTPLVALFGGLGLATIGQWRPVGPDPAHPAGRGAWRPALGLLVAVILLGSTALSVKAYFVDWGGSPDLFYAYDEGLWDIADYVKTLPPNENILISPRPAGDATLAFAWRSGPAVRHFDGRAGFVVPQPGRPTTYIVIEHEDVRGAGLLTQLFPQATVSRVFRDRQDQVYARAFQVPAGAKPVRQPKYTASVSWPAIDLVGYDLDKRVYHPGDIIYLQLWWRATATPDTEWTVFTHLLGPAKPDGSTLWAGEDGMPGRGSLPATTWRAGDLVLDEYQIPLGPDLPAGTYQIEVGLYNQAGGGQRAVTDNPPGLDHFILGQVGVQ